MPDRRLWMPRCRTCGPLGKPTGLGVGLSGSGTRFRGTGTEGQAERQTKHQTAWYPTYAQIIVKGTPNDCE